MNTAFLLGPLCGCLFCGTLLLFGQLPDGAGDLDWECLVFQGLLEIRSELSSARRWVTRPLDKLGHLDEPFKYLVSSSGSKFLVFRFCG
ncbi:hypothetical protein [Streptomyces nitrosporeus]|uniref:hypothetical protein n=1 Tax=Streptomyces nitrosporeus TaxID=28894 RepID=UPI0039A13B70